MVTTYKNPTRVARKASEVSTAWEQIAPDAEFAGMTLTAFKTAIGESFTLRERAAQLEAELSANLARRAIADAETNDKVKLVVNSVKGSPPTARTATSTAPWVTSRPPTRRPASPAKAWWPSLRPSP